MKLAVPWMLPNPRWRLCAAALALALVCGCGALTPAAGPHPRFFALTGARGTTELAQAGLPAAATAPTLIVSPPRAAAGFDSHHIVYVRQASQLEHYAHNEWVDTPAR